MSDDSASSTEKAFGCENCPMRRKAEEKPESFMARIWRWHTRWCPGWKAYQAHLAGQDTASGD
ncbi:MAG: hypothetical protein JXA25_08150 [Anaerolineales bacterium]|nr:hypothetical protein [Anaerolineales bacterium]